MPGTLDAGSHDRLGTTLALLRVNHEAAGSHLASYLPFAYHCLRRVAEAGKPVSARQVQASLREEFGIRLPLGVVRSLLREAAAEGKLREENRMYFPVADQLADCDLGPARKEFGRRFAFLAGAVAQRAQEVHGLTWGVLRAKDLLIRYAEGFSSDILAAAIGGYPVPVRAPHEVGPDLYVIHEFARWASANRPDEFDFLVGLVKARMLSDSLYLDIEQGQEEALGTVEVYFDGPILLYALGNAGDEIQAPYVELIEMLDAQGAKLRCFHHSIVEAQGILDVAANRKSMAIRGEQYFGDVVGFLVRSDRSHTDIELQAESLVRDLAEIGIEEVDPPDRIPALQPDEEALESLIKVFIPTIKAHALVKDVDSLIAIHTLRRGRVPRTVSSSRAILVTHNYALFKASARFFRERHGGRTVPHCVYDASFTTLVWLHGSKRFPDLPREVVLADAAAALQPSDELWKRYNEATQALFERETIDEDDLRFLRYSQDAKSLLMDLTRGNPETFSEATVPELLDLYRQRSVREVQEEVRATEDRLAQEQLAHEATREAVETERGKQVATRVRVSDLSDSVARWTCNVLFGALVVLLALGIVLGPAGPVDAGLPLVVQIVCAAFALGFSIWVGALGGSLKDLRDAVEGPAAARIERLLLRVLRID